MSRVEVSLQQKFRELTNKTFILQAKWFLNGFWEEIDREKDTEFVWKAVGLCTEISKHKGKAGELDEFEAHRFLEKLGETLTVQEMRKKLSEIDVDFNKMMALTEYLIFKYGKSVKQVVNAPQGGNVEELKQAEKLVEASQAAFDELSVRTENQKKVLGELKQAEAEAAKTKADADAAFKDASDSARAASDAASVARAKEETALSAAQTAKAKAIEAENESVNASRKAEEAKESEANARNKEAESQAAATVAKQAEDASTQAANEQRQALKELKDIEDALAAKIADLELKSQDGPVVQRGRAKAELEQLKSGDSLPLRRAKINQEAAVRRFQKAELRNQEEAAKASQAAAIASAAAALATQTRNQAELAAQSAARAHEESIASERTASQAAHASSLAAAAAAAAHQSAVALEITSQETAAIAAQKLQEVAEKRAEAEVAAQQLEIALADATVKFNEAIAFLEVVKKQPGQANGDIWWMTRELLDKQRFLPASKQQVVKLHK